MSVNNDSSDSYDYLQHHHVNDDPIIEEVPPSTSFFSQLGSLFFSKVSHSKKRREEKSSRQKTDQKESFDSSIRKQTQELKFKNKESERIWETIRNIIEKDEEIITCFAQCALETKDILLAPPRPDDCEPLTDPVVEEWRVESQKAHQFECMKTRFLDFLEKNPRFTRLLKEKYNSEWSDGSPTQNRLISFLGQEVHPLPPPASGIVQVSGPPQEPPVILPNDDKGSLAFLSSLAPAQDELISSKRPFEERNWESLLTLKNEDQIRMFERISALIRSDATLSSLFQRDYDPSFVRQGAALLENSSSRSSPSPIEFQSEEQLKLMREHFFEFLDTHPELKSRIEQKMRFTQ